MTDHHDRKGLCELDRKQKYDIAAYIWPAYCNDERTKIFWPEGIGEWESVMSAKAKFEGHNWPRKPLWGYLNEADPYVMEMQINAAADHGVNVFIYDWYWYDKRPFLENCLDNGYLKARNQERVKFYIMWANHHASTTWDKRISDEGDRIIWSGYQDRNEFEKICDRIINKYFSQPSYYKIDNKPVFLIYELETFIEGIGGIQEAADAIAWFRKRVKESGYDGVHLQCTMRRSMDKNITGISGDNNDIQKYAIDQIGFDSMTHYQFCHFTDVNRDYMEIIKDVEREWNKLDQEYAIPYCPHVSIGWDNNPRFQYFRQDIVKNNCPENFEKALRLAKEYVDKHQDQIPLITINSWNEWTESSYLQPDNLYGYGYLESIKKVFGRE